MRRLLLLLLLAVSIPATYLYANHLEYLISTTGIKIASLDIDHDQQAQSVQFRIKSINVTKLFPSLDNLYTVNYDSSFRPRTYNRSIKQDRLIDSVVTSYDHKLCNAILTKSLSQEESAYQIEPNSRDFFSFVLMLMRIRAENGSYPIDGNGKNWVANLEYLGDETLRTVLGKFSTSVYEIRLCPQTEEKTPYIDMISHSILDPEVTIQLWIADNKTTIKAIARKKLITTSIDLVKIGS